MVLACMSPEETGSFYDDVLPIQINGDFQSLMGRQDADTFAGITAQLTSIAIEGAEAKSLEEFEQFKKRNFPRYCKRILAAMNFVQSTSISADATADIVRDLYKRTVEVIEGAVTLTQEERVESIFCLATLDRAHGFAHLCRNPLLNSQDSAKDAELALEFNADFIYAQFHLGCLLASIRLSKPLPSEVVYGILDGFREGSLECYSTVREAIDLRLATPDASEYACDRDAERGGVNNLSAVG